MRYSKATVFPEPLMPTAAITKTVWLHAPFLEINASAFITYPLGFRFQTLRNTEFNHVEIVRCLADQRRLPKRVSPPHHHVLVFARFNHAVSFLKSLIALSATPQNFSRIVNLEEPEISLPRSEGERKAADQEAAVA